MTDEQSDTGDMQGIAPYTFRDLLLRNIMHNRQMIVWHSQQVKIQRGVFREIEERYLAKLIEAEEAYEAELRAVTPDL